MDLALPLKILPGICELDPMIVQKLIDFQAAQTEELPKFSIRPKLLTIGLQTESLA
jgi:hypothetical protein